MSRNVISRMTSPAITLSQHQLLYEAVSAHTLFQILEEKAFVIQRDALVTLRSQSITNVSIIVNTLHRISLTSSLILYPTSHHFHFPSFTSPISHPPNPRNVPTPRSQHAIPWAVYSQHPHSHTPAPPTILSSILLPHASPSKNDASPPTRRPRPKQTQPACTEILRKPSPRTRRHCRPAAWRRGYSTAREEVWY